jgi:hypothetical protein
LCFAWSRVGSLIHPPAAALDGSASPATAGEGARGESPPLSLSPKRSPSPLSPLTTQAHARLVRPLLNRPKRLETGPRPTTTRRATNKARRTQKTDPSVRNPTNISRVPSRRKPLSPRARAAVIRPPEDKEGRPESARHAAARGGERRLRRAPVAARAGTAIEQHEEAPRSPCCC